jgi:hypothetical protein
MKTDRNCLSCGSKIEGRIDKLYCSVYCKSSYHYEKEKEKTKSLFKTIDQQLKHNRNLLKHFNQAGKTTIRKSELLAKNFNPKYFTHYWKNGKGEVYLFCYEFGFLSIKDGKQDKYVLVQWQSYMET